MPVFWDTSLGQLSGAWIHPSVQTIREVSPLILGLAAKESPNTTMLFVGAACAGVVACGEIRAVIAVAMATSLVLMFMWCPFVSVLRTPMTLVFFQEFVKS